MKLYSILILCAFVIDGINGQQELIPNWSIQKHTNSDTNAEGWGLDLDHNGNVYWPISSDSLNEGFDIHCYKYDDKGNALWQSPIIYGGQGTQQAYVCNSNGGSVYIGGRNCLGLINSCDMLLIKLDSHNGELLWDKTQDFSSNGYDEIDGLEILDGNVYCGGWAQELETGTYNSDMGFWSLDTSGTTLWTNTFGKTGSAEHQDGHFVVDENHIYAAGLWNGTGLANLYNGHSFLGTFSKEDGSFIDSTLLDHQSNALFDIENALGMTSDGTHLYLTGYSTPSGSDDWQIFIAKYDKQLNKIWQKEWGGEGTETARGIIVKDDLIFIAGNTASPSITLSGNDISDGLLLIYNVDGSLVDYQVWGDQQDNSFRDISADDNFIYLSGTSQSSDNNKSAFLIQTNGPIVNSNMDSSTPKVDLNIYPNPSQGLIQINLTSYLNGSLFVSDIIGNLVYDNHNISGETSIEIKLENPGLYFVSYQTQNQLITKKVFNYSSY